MKDITDQVAQRAAFRTSLPAAQAGIPQSGILHHPGGLPPAQPPPPQPPDFASCLLTAAELSAMALVPRTPLLGHWLREGDLGYLFAPRGGGKTWLAMLIGQAVATGGDLGLWAAGEESRPVYYFDAEMNQQDVQARADRLGIVSEGFHWLSNEHLYMKLEHSANIADPLHQQGLSSMLPDGSVFIIDNLSTGQSGMRENENDDFDVIKDWLLSLRRRAITVIIIHHAGRNGEMRGGSRREDPAHWILSLKDATEDGSCAKEFVTRFSKCRNCRERDAPPLRWALKETSGRFTVYCDPFGNTDALLTYIKEGVTSATELADMFGVQCGTISKWAKKLMTAGLIRKKGREYALMEE